VPGAPPFTQEQLDIGVGVQLDPDARERLLVGAEVEVLGVDEDTVVVEQDRVDVQGGAQGNNNILRNIRMSAIISMR
jgi:hypothetical protein